MHAPRRGFLRLLIVAAFVVATLAGGARPAAAATAYLDGFITSKATGAPLANVCVTLGPPVICTITSLQVDFYSFSSGVLVARRDICALKPGQSFADVPNNDTDLSNDAQFAVVVKSFMTDIVAVVNEHQGSGGRAEAGSYDGA